MKTNGEFWLPYRPNPRPHYKIYCRECCGPVPSRLSKLRLPISEKQCKLCHIFKAVSEFGIAVAYADGYRNWCKACYVVHNGKPKSGKPVGHPRRDTAEVRYAKVRERQRRWNALHRHDPSRRAADRLRSKRRYYLKKNRLDPADLR